MIGSLSPTGPLTPSFLAHTDATPSMRRADGDDPTQAASEKTPPKKPAQGEQAANQLSESDRQKIRALQQSDRRVRAHEMAHVSVGGNLVRSGASFTYETGPDGQRYAIGGEVSIDVSPGRRPEETLDKAAHIKATALAPADPSAQDRQVAALATQMAMQANVELVAQRGEASTTSSRGSPATVNPAGNRMQAAYSASSAAGYRASTGSALDLFA